MPEREVCTTISSSSCLALTSANLGQAKETNSSPRRRKKNLASPRNIYAALLLALFFLLLFFPFSSWKFMAEKHKKYSPTFLRAIKSAVLLYHNVDS
jgi:hypothetical protein